MYQEEDEQSLIENDTTKRRWCTKWTAIFWTFATALVIFGIMFLGSMLKNDDWLESEEDSAEEKETFEGVEVIFYGEAFCPYCLDLITGSLSDAIDLFGLDGDVMSLDIVGFGNSYYYTEDCG